MLQLVLLLPVVVGLVGGCAKQRYRQEDVSTIDVIDLSQPATLRVMSDFYGAVEKKWKICINCGLPGIGTVMHLEHGASVNSMHPAMVPAEYLVASLAVIDVSSLVKLDPKLVLTLDVALQWMVLKRDPKVPTLLMFKFGWEYESKRNKLRSCICKVPGISYELAAWISNMTHVVGVATDCPSIESEQTRELTEMTVSNLLGRSGIYMLENVNLKRKIPERGCMTTAMPLKLDSVSYVPARLVAFCPAEKTSHHVVLALTDSNDAPNMIPSRNNDVDLKEILN